MNTQGINCYGRGMKCGGAAEAAAAIKNWSRLALTGQDDPTADEIAAHDAICQIADAVTDGGTSLVEIEEIAGRLSTRRTVRVYRNGPTKKIVLHWLDDAMEYGEFAVELHSSHDGKFWRCTIGWDDSDGNAAEYLNIPEGGDWGKVMPCRPRAADILAEVNLPPETREMGYSARIALRAAHEAARKSAHAHSSVLDSGRS